MKEKRTLGFGLILVTLGVIIILEGILGIRISEIVSFAWPFLLVLAGWYIFNRERKQRGIKENIEFQEKFESTENDISEKHSADYLSQSQLFGDASIRLNSKNFRGGSASTFIGNIHINLSEIDFSEGTKNINISCFIGDIDVTLPRGIEVNVRGSSMIGDTYILGRNISGFFKSVSEKSEAYEESAKKLIINISSGIGDIHVA